MFRLLRYFSLASAGAIFVVIALLMVFFRHLSVEDLINIGERQNEILARSIGNHVWSNIGPNFSSIKEADRETILNKPETREISRILSIQIKGLPVLKVDFLNLKGFIIFSTARNQIGEDRSRAAEFISALNGRPVSKITQLNAGDDVARMAGDSEILLSYLPFRDDKGKVVGVFRVFSETTSLLADIDKHVLHVFIALLAALSLLYFVLYQVVRRADNTIKRQHADLLSSERALRESEEKHRRFSTDVAHELRTPLALLRVQFDNLGNTEVSQTLKKTSTIWLDWCRKLWRRRNSIQLPTTFPKKLTCE